MQSLSTCGNCIHWSTSIRHAIIVYMRKLYSLVYLHSTCNHCLHAETVFTGLPPSNMQSLSTCGNCIHWSTSIRHAIIVYMRKLYSLVYLHSTCNHCLRAKTVFTGLPPFNMQSLSICENCIHWSTSIQHAVIVYMRKLYSLVYLHSTCNHCLHAETVFIVLPPSNMQSLSTCENCIHWSTSIQHVFIVLPPSNMQSLSTCRSSILHSICNHFHAYLPAPHPHPPSLSPSLSLCLFPLSDR